MGEDSCEISPVKIVMVGDVRVGKTALIQRFISNQPPSLYLPTGFDKYSAAFEVGGYNFYATIWDTSGSPTYDTVRPLAYQDTDVFLICFHLGDWYSLNNAVNKWYPEVRKYSAPGTPIILCGCQNDQRFVENLYASFQISPTLDQKRKTVYSEEALEAQRQIGAVTYVESCAFNPVTAREAFEVCVLAASGKLHNGQSLLSAKHLGSLSSSLTLSSSSPSSTDSSCTSTKLKSSASTHLLTRHKSLFKLRKCKSKSELKLDSKKSCSIM